MKERGKEEGGGGGREKGRGRRLIHNSLDVSSFNSVNSTVAIVITCAEHTRARKH